MTIGIRSYFWRHYVATRLLKPRSIYSHDRSLRILCEHLGHDPAVDSVVAEDLSHLLVSLGNRYAPSTLRRLRINVLSTLRDAARRGLCEEPKRVYCPKLPLMFPEAWTIDEVRALLKACRKLSRFADYFEAFILACWDTGLRKEDLELLQMVNGRVNGTPILRLVLAQEKTSDAILVGLRPATIEALTRLRSERPLEWPISKRQFWYWFGKLCKLAEVPHGGPQRLRRSAATAVELLHPGSASHFLGHRSPGLAKSHYLDPRILQRNLFQPPPL